MFFRNLLIYPVDPASVQLTQPEFEAALASQRAKPCPPNQPSSYGFVPPVGKGDDALLSHMVEGIVLLKAQKEERIIPTSVIRDMVNEKIEEIEVEEQRKVQRKERTELTDMVTTMLLPRAFIRRSFITAAIDPQKGYIYINTPTPDVAEELLSRLREALGGSMPPRTFQFKHNITDSLTQWFRTQAPGHNIELGNQADLYNEGQGTVKVSDYDLGSEEIAKLLESGHRVSQVALDWDNKLTFNLNEKFQLKRLRFSDLMQEQAAQDAGEDEDGEHDASLLLMVRSFGDMLTDLFAALGGMELHTPIIAKAGGEDEQTPGYTSPDPEPQTVEQETEAEAAY